MRPLEHGEPPSRLQSPCFMVGQDRRGNWVVQDQSATRGGLFVNHNAALRFVRDENGDQPPTVVMVSEVLELDMTRKPAVIDRQGTLDAAKAA
jgi:hypothetical protein